MAGRVDADRPRRLTELGQRLPEELEKGANRAGGPPMIASISEKPWRAARTTDCGLPPTPIQTGKGDSRCGTTSWSCSAARVVPSQVTGPPFTSSANRAVFSSNSRS